ncbi:uncharacterized protein LOC124542795 [Vanessa cardui]|uniref:uncharacterized protein LOC124542795 n=1 Tax=Vanessa cardui TaxID=171605 RepID=UPI001F13DA92|nr:uncharacterized protein LOC124542795 [Vanessa cardui]
MTDKGGAEQVMEVSFTSASDQSSPNFVTQRIRSGVTEQPMRREFQDFQNAIMNKLDNWFLHQQTLFSRILEDFADLKNPYTTCFKRVGEIEKRLEQVKQQPKDTSHLEAKIDMMEQQARQCNLEIANRGTTTCPERRGENLIKIVEELGTAIKLTINAGDIVSAHRVPHADNKSTHPKNIIVKLHTRVRRDNILAAARMKKGIYTENLQISGDKRKIFVNEHLTLKNKKLFRSAREVCKKQNLRFVWVKHGCVLVRENETSHVIAIRKEEDLSKIKPKR